MKSNSPDMMKYHLFGILLCCFRFLLKLRLFERFRHLTLIIRVYIDITTFIVFFVG